jgi:succinate dehydrogenase / fumarate reductase membrane anchor subunit
MMRRPKPIRSAGAFEYGMWLFTRISGLALMLFAAVSMGIAFSLGGRTQLDMSSMFRWMFFPNPNHVINSNIPDVTAGWSNAFWQIYSMLMILLAGIHGFNGVRMILEDYIERPLIIAILRGLTVLLLVGAMIVAVYVILAS